MTILLPFFSHYFYSIFSSLSYRYIDDINILREKKKKKKKKIYIYIYIYILLMKFKILNLTDLYLILKYNT